MVVLTVPEAEGPDAAHGAEEETAPSEAGHGAGFQGISFYRSSWT